MTVVSDTLKIMTYMVPVWVNYGPRNYSAPHLDASGPGFGQYTPKLGTTKVVTAGGNVTLGCPAAKDTFVLHLEWKCRECQLPGEPIVPHEMPLVEYRGESTTFFHHEGRMSLSPKTYSLSFKPVRASDSGTYVCRVNNRDES